MTRCFFFISSFFKRNYYSIVFLLLFGIVACSNKEDEKKPENEDCITTADILGPFYRANAPFRNELNVNSRPGTFLNITGTVYGEECDIPIENAKIEIWHADDSGEYDNTSQDYEFRGIVMSNLSGVYDFSTIVPGRYLNVNTYRPGHIHFKITADGYKELITQLYFEDDPYLDSDPWASDESATQRIIPLDEDMDGNKSGVFDIILIPD